ncbi:single-stranded-DNA-specific exonuclease RecJ [Salinibacter sp. 10B]|uniref:single-stranded-DNA-specific exonuclease RecJ n=1 Tax=Salinibacter sp. 10B TaxID=1923971 RepID=UPI000CF37148|nr:single-stranded-DNA-specific exonuclease RecJ [Salinibacter sp. 10B]PQJ36807.1 single-stranded-DNA-specific exonuclease RecJ [Salinibacter sp. 10B]
MAEWIQPPSPPVPDEIKTLVGGNALVAQLLAQRGIQSVEEARPFLNPDCYTPSPPEALPDLEAGARRIQEAIETGQRILVWGDFDVDGQTSTALLVDALTELGADVSYHIPLRETESHGVNTENLAPYLDEGIEVVLTCDTGISSHEALELAASRGADVVVTDHHDLPAELPPAKALINPKRLEKDHPLRTLPGVGVAYKFIQALAENTDLDPTDYLDLVALGIVADIAHQRKDTRYLLQRGLEKLQETRRPGLRAVMQNANVTPEAADEEDIGYQIGPRLNAVGRLGDANISVPLLTTEDPEEATEIASQLEELNDRRRLLTDQVFESARQKIRRSPHLLQYAVLLLYGEQWPAGVIGIVAHRLVEEYHKPAILLTSADQKSEGPPLARGSARSIEDLDISGAIGDHADILESFGGHPMAAGLTLPESEIARFRRLVSRSIVEQKGGEELTPTLQIDSYVSLEDLTLDLVDAIQQLAPFGPGNREVVLACRNLQVGEVKEIGESGDHLKITVTDREGRSQQVLNWNAAKQDLPSGVFDLALKISDNVFRGERSVQLTWEDARERRKEPTGQEDGQAKPSVKTIDHRGEEDLASLLRKLDEKEDTQVWLEATSVTGVDARSRSALTLCKELVVGTIPPSRQVLQETLQDCQPEVLHIVGVEPEVDTLPTFTRRLLGLSKHAIKTGKSPSLQQLAEMMAHEKSTVRLGLSWLQEKGKIQVSGPDSRLQIEAGAGKGSPNSETSQELKRSLEEARAYRRYAFSTYGSRVQT